MKNEEKELLIKDLTARLPYGVKIQVCNLNEYAPIVKGFLNDELYVQFDYTTKPTKNGDSTYNIINDSVKPYLRPMLSMTEEEHKEYKKARDGDTFDSAIALKQKDEGKRYISSWYRGTDWLNEHHFDYRGLIEKGFALEAPKEMYK